MEYTWDEAKNQLLQQTRGISFEEVVLHMDAGGLVAYRQNPDYANQELWLVAVRGYIYVVPCIVSDKDVRFITIYPSRKQTALHLKREAEENREVANEKRRNQRKGF